MFAEALGVCGGRVEKFRRDGWAPPWPFGLEMLCYMLSHEVHPRRQVYMLAHQPKEVAYRIWKWEKWWEGCGSPAGPGYDS